MKQKLSMMILFGIIISSVCFTTTADAAYVSLLKWSKTGNVDGSPYDVAVDGTGVYIVGYDRELGASNLRWRIEKRDLEDGSLIWKKTPNPSSGWDEAFSVAVYGSSIYIVGYDRKPGYGDSRWRIEKRSTADGSLIWKKTTNPSSEWDVAKGVAVDSTGIYIVGYDNKPTSYPGVYKVRWRMEKRSHSDGSIIWVKHSSPSNVVLARDEAVSVAVIGSGVYVVGFDEKTGDKRWRIEKRSTAVGGLIWKKTSNPSSAEDSPEDVAVDGSGVYIVGHDMKLGYNVRWRIESRDPTTGNINWIKAFDPSSGADGASSVVIASHGLYVAGGFGWTSEYGDSKWRTEWRNPYDKSLLMKMNSNPSSGNDHATGVAVDGTGVIEGIGVYSVGSESVPGTLESRWHMEKRIIFWFEPLP